MKNKFLISLRALTLLLVMCLSIGNVWGTDVDSGESQFTATSGDLDSYISYSSAKGGGTNSPALNSGNVRIYRKDKNTAGLGGTFTVTAASPAKITAITLTVTNAACKVSIDGGTAEDKNAASISYTDINASSIMIQNNSTSQFDIKRIQVTYSGGKSLSAISIKTHPTKTEYIEGEYFAPAGLVITKTFSDETTEDLTYEGSESSFSFNPSLSTALTTSDDKVTITVGSQSADQNITVNAKQLATITLYEAGTEVAGPTDKYPGESYTLPLTVSHDCGTKTFMGWSTVEITVPDEKPTSNYYEPGAEVTLATENTFYAVYATSGGEPTKQTIETVGFESGEGYTATSTYNSSNYTTGSKGSKWTINYGAFATAGAIVGSQSAQFRIYNGTGGGFGQLYNSVAYTEDIVSVGFSAKTANTNGQVKVSYSLDGSSWTDIETKSLTTSKADYSVDVPVSGARFVKFTAVGTRPTSGNYAIYVDAVVLSAMRTSYTDYATTCGGTPTATKPSLPTACSFSFTPFNVTITNGEDDATVYYTVDDTDPTTSTPTYFTGASTTIQLSAATTTVKAMAVISEKNPSAIASATYTYEAPLTTIAAMKAISASSDVPVKAQLTNVIVTYADASIAYIQDAERGLYIYGSNSLTAGKQISANLVGNMQTYANLVEFKPTSIEVTASADATIPETEITIADLIGDNFSNYESMRMKVVGATTTAFSNRNATLTQNSSSITARAANTDPAIAAEANDVVIAKGYPGLYNSTKQLNIMVQADYAHLPSTKNLAVLAVDNGVITATPEGSSAIAEGENADVEEGANVTLAQTEDSGYRFMGWVVKDADNEDVTVTENVFVMPTKNVTVSASFNQEFQIQVTENDSEKGEGAFNTSPSSYSKNMIAGEQAEIIATVLDDENDEFVNWTVSPENAVTFENANASSTTITTTASAATITANFRAKVVKYDAYVDVNAVAYGTATINGDDTGVQAGEGDVMTIVATKNDGYRFVNWTAEPAVTFADANSASTTFPMIAEEVTVTANFEKIPVASVSLNKSTTKIEIGSSETLIATILPDDALDKSIVWESSNTSVATVDDNGVISTVAVGSATITATSYDNLEAFATCAVTVTPIAKWQKVSAAKLDWTGEYLLVYEGTGDDEGKAFAWTGVDGTSCIAEATITSGEIDKPDGSAILNIAAMTGGYSIQIKGGANDGQYIGKTASGNGMDMGPTAYVNTLAITDNSAVITGAGGSTLRYNSSSDQKRFRYYGTGQKAVQLYERASTDPIITLDPDEYDFGTIKDNVQKPQDFTISANSYVTGTLVASLEGTDAGMFSVSEIVDNQVTVTFNPNGTVKDNVSASLKITADNANVSAALTGNSITHETPEITLNKSVIDFGVVQQDAALPASQTVTATLAYLAEANVAITGSAFSVSPATLTASGDITIAPLSTAVEGDFEETITVSGDGAESKEVTVRFTVASKWAATFTSNIDLGSSDKVTLNGESTEYVALKAGGSKSAGTVNVTFPAGVTDIHFHAVGWKGETVTLTVYNGSTSIGEFALTADEGATSNSTWALQNDPVAQYKHIELAEALSEETEITFTATAGYRFILFGVNQEGGPEVTSISISGEATKLTYIEGEEFNPAGLTVMANYNIGDPQDVTANSTFTFDPALLSAGQTSVSVTAHFQEFNSAPLVVNGLTVSAITLESIKLSGNYKTTFHAGDVFNHDNLVVIAIYSNEDEEDVTDDAVVSNPDMSKAGKKTVTVTYGGKEATYDIIVLAATIVFYESFDTNNGTGGNDDQWSGSIASNAITSDNEGWTFVKGNGANKCAKFGAGSNLGSAQTPEIAGTGDFVITFKAAAWNGSTENLNLAISTTNGSLSQSAVVLEKAKWNNYSIALTGVTANFQITIAAAQTTNNRFFLDEVMVQKAYVRTLTSSNIGTICLDKEPSIESYSGATFYEILNKDADEKNVYFQEVVELEAGMPYIFQPSANVLILPYVSEETSEAQDNNGLYGWLDNDFKFNSQIDSKDAYFVSGGQIVRCGNNCTILKNRAYIVLDDIASESQVSATPGRRRLTLGVEGKGVATGMEEAIIMSNGELKKVVIDGQFYILRDGKVFDAQGKLVK